MADRVTGRLVTAGFEDAVRAAAVAMAEFQRSVKETMRRINEALAITPEARAYMAFLDDGGDPEFIEAVEEHFGVTHGGLP